MKSAFGSDRRYWLGGHVAALPSSRRFPSRPPSHAIAGPALAAAFMLAWSGVGFAQTIREKVWATNGPVVAVVRNGGTIYISGDFTQVGPATGGGVPLDAASGALPASFPKVVGTIVKAVVSDGAGGWYIGGFFTAVGGSPRSNLAHVASDLSVSAWDPNASDSVSALAVSGSTVYVGGAFTSIGGQARNYIAALDAASGAATAWNPNADNDVSALAVSGSTIYASGSFVSIGGQARNYIAALDASTGAATAWNPNANNPVSALAVSGSTVYAGGSFTSMGAQARNYIAALDATTGTATAWNPNADGPAYALAVSGSTVYAGGGFTSMGAQARNYIAALDATTGAATAWNPNPNNQVSALAVSGSTVYASGSFTSMGAQARNYIAALDATTGAATAWNPNADASVFAIVVSGSTIYAGGLFNIIGQAARKGIAALDATSGLATAWDPNPDSWIAALAVSGSTVYAGGAFSRIGGQARSCIAALDAATGAATAWAPNALPGDVNVLAVSGSIVYAAGQFANIGGQARNNIAALDATTGAATAWNPNADDPENTSSVYALAVSGSIVYAGGYFTSIGGLPQRYFAGIMGDLTTPTLLLLVSAHAAPGRVELTWFAATGDISTATVYRRTVRDDWEALGQISPDGTGHLTYEDTRVTAGTRYGYRLGVMEAGKEVFLGETWVDVPVTLELALAFRSNPAREELGVAFSLPDASPARLELFDVGGRRIASRDVGTLGAGSHTVTLGDGRRFAPGVYLLRLSHGTRSLTARGVILR